MNLELKRQRFEHLLKMAGETCSSLAKKTKISSSTFYNFRNGRSNGFDWDTIEKISPLLNVKPENFWKDAAESVVSSAEPNSSIEALVNLYKRSSEDVRGMFDDIYPRLKASASIGRLEKRVNFDDHEEALLKKTGSSPTGV